MSVLDELKATLKQLVAIDSTSQRSNAPMIDHLEKRLTAAGFRCERQGYRDEAGVEKTNLLARYGQFEVAKLALVGHTDCVPYDADWKEALSLQEKEQKLFGRGACDTKAFVACALVAAERKKRDGLLLIFTADEEVGCTGAKKLVDAQKGKARFAIVGEPTSLRPIRAHKGYCIAEVEVHGKEGHSAYPDSGASAIFRASRFLKRLEERSRGELRAKDELDDQFDPPFTTVNVGVIAGGKAKNIIPGSCRFIVEWRPIPRQGSEHVSRLLDDVLREMKSEEPEFSASIKVTRLDRGVETKPDSAVVRFITEQTGKQPETVSFGTEAPQLTELGAEAVVFGPGDIRVAHRTGEFVPVAELQRCEEILEAAIDRFVTS
ncbi:MAG: acetylornithine deacetylase [Myxococcaceae bacterium]